MKSESSGAAVARSRADGDAFHDLRRHGEAILAQLDPKEFLAYAKAYGALKADADSSSRMMDCWLCWGNKRKPLAASPTRAKLLCEATYRFEREDSRIGNVASDALNLIVGADAVEVARVCLGMPNDAQEGAFWRAVHPWGPDFAERRDAFREALASLEQEARSHPPLPAAAPALTLERGERVLDMELFYQKFPNKKGNQEAVRMDRSTFLREKNGLRYVKPNWIGPEETCRKLEGR